MGQDKMQLTKLLAFVKELYDHPDNKKFAAGLNAIVLNRLTITTNQDIKKVKELWQDHLETSNSYYVRSVATSMGTPATDGIRAGEEITPGYPE